MPHAAPSLWLSLLASAVLAVLLPLVFGQIMLGALGRLHVEPGTAVALMIAIVAGGFVNLPVRRIAHDHDVVVHPFAVFGLGHRFPRLQRIRRETVIAVKLGGCVIPSALVLYELSRLDATGDGGVRAAVLARASTPPSATSPHVRCQASASPCRACRRPWWRRAQRSCWRRRRRPRSPTWPASPAP